MHCLRDLVGAGGAGCLWSMFSTALLSKASLKPVGCRMTGMTKRVLLPGAKETIAGDLGPAPLSSRLAAAWRRRVPTARRHQPRTIQAREAKCRAAFHVEHI